MDGVGEPLDVHEVAEVVVEHQRDLVRVCNSHHNDSRQYRISNIKHI
jgi:hypothetical protein